MKPCWMCPMPMGNAGHGCTSRVSSKRKTPQTPAISCGCYGATGKKSATATCKRHARKGGHMDILNQDASTLAQMISDNQLGVAELAQETLAQIGRTNGPVNAIVAAVNEDEVLAEARRMDDARATGQGAGRLYGLP